MNRITTVRKGSKPRDFLWRDCHRVLLPVANELRRTEWLEGLLQEGTSALVLGETRAEYLAREMSSERTTVETGEHIRSFVADLERMARGNLLVAVDQEPWGIQRLHRLVPAYPSRDQLIGLATPDLSNLAREVAETAKQMGVSMFLSPVLDVLHGANPWLEGRTLEGTDGPEDLGRVAATLIVGTQTGGVATVAKHFPGFPRLAKDPALHTDAVVVAGSWDERCLVPFKAATRAGAAGVMLGPAVVEDLDSREPASTSMAVVHRLRRGLGFAGLVVSDDLDAPATLNGRSLASTAIASLRAGADLLLVGGGDHLSGVVESIYEVARADDSFVLRVHAAAGRVMATARTFTAPRRVR